MQEKNFIISSARPKGSHPKMLLLRNFLLYRRT